MQLYKKPNSPYWWMDMTVNGRRVRKSTGRPHSDKKGAQRVLATAYEKAMNEKQFKEKPEITLDEAFEITLGETEGQTQRIYKSAREALRTTVGGDTLLSGITSADVDRHVSRRRREGLKPNSIRVDLKALKRTINRVGATHKVNRDIDWPVVKPFLKTRYLTSDEEAEVHAILKAQAEGNVTAEKALALFVFLIDTGLRLMEAVEIEWSQIDMTSKVIEVYRSKTKTTTMVPMSERVYQMLLRRSNYETPFEKMDFAIRHLRKVIGEVANQNQRIVDTRGKATIHTLRDTFATRMLKKGMPLERLSKLMGHTNTAMTLKYAQIEPEDVVDEARRIINAG